MQGLSAGNWSGIWAQGSKCHLAKILPPCTHTAPPRSREKNPLIPEANTLLNIQFSFLRRWSSYKTFRWIRHPHIHPLFPKLAPSTLANIPHPGHLGECCLSSTSQRPRSSGITLQSPDGAPASCLTQRPGISANHHRHSSHCVFSSLLTNLSSSGSCFPTCWFHFSAHGLRVRHPPPAATVAHVGQAG